MRRTARPASRRRISIDDAAVLGVGAHQDLVRVGDAPDQLAHLALHLGHRGHEPRRVRGLRHADVEAHVGTPVLLPRRPLRHPGGAGLEPGEVVLVGALDGEHRGARLHGHARVEDRARGLAERVLDAALRERGLVGHEGPAGAPAQSHEVSALDERGQRVAQGGAGDPQPAGELALGRQLAAGRQQAQADRGAEAPDRLLEGRGRLHRLEDGLECRTAHGCRASLHAAKVHSPRHCREGRRVDSRRWTCGRRGWWSRPTAIAWRAC